MALLTELDRYHGCGFKTSSPLRPSLITTISSAQQIQNRVDVVLPARCRPGVTVSPNVAEVAADRPAAPVKPRRMS